ncbi:hypothetical protein A3Q56_03236 [Intoshia linei]|uniref:Uncharacterized protein n=1 Tax=Intoshia linei TaxID=1819745 RepID=A0A177B416_9BILA|nr:hypothetical protein A3Q56_03236 [Intoshia linei]
MYNVSFQLDKFRENGRQDFQLKIEIDRSEWIYDSNLYEFYVQNHNTLSMNVIHDASYYDHVKVAFFNIQTKRYFENSNEKKFWFDLVDAIRFIFNLSVSKVAVSHHLNNLLYTLKTIRHEPENAKTMLLIKRKDEILL